MIHCGNICKMNGAKIEPVDVIIGGSPCQDLSVAGNRAGLAGERSGLFMEQIRVVKEMRENEKRNGKSDINIRPRFMLWENVAGALSSKSGDDFHAVLEEIAHVADPNAIVPRFEGGGEEMDKLRRNRGRWVVSCLENTRCTVLGSPPTSS